MLKIRQRGGFKPYGAAVSIIEHAQWDIAGKAAGVPVYKLLGGKVRDQVRTYNDSPRAPMDGTTPEHYAAGCKRMMALPEGFDIFKQGIAFHSPMRREFDGFYCATPNPVSPFHGAMDSSPIAERGIAHMIDCVAAMKEVLGGKVALALDCGPGWMVPDAIRFARAAEKYNLLWLEDMLTGDYGPWVDAGIYRDQTISTTTPIHTGEQIYRRQNFKQLIETRAVNVVGPDPAEAGAIAERKWIAEYAHLHGILMAPHGTGNGLLGLAA